VTAADPQLRPPLPVRVAARVWGRDQGAHGVAALLLFAVAVAALVVAAALVEVRGNAASRLATMETLVDYGEWQINQSVFRYETVDKVRVGGLFYSSKPPVYSTIGAVLYAGIQTVTGWTFATATSQVVTLLRLLLHVLPFGVGVVFAGRFLARTIPNRDAWFWALAPLTAGTLLFGYSATINNHAAAALLILAALLGFAELRRRPETPAATWAGLGFLTALAPVFDFGAAVFAIALTLALAVTRPRALVPFLLGAMIPCAVHLHLTWRLTGSLYPFYKFGAIYHYPGSYWSAPEDFDALNEPRWIYAFHALIGHHGLFSMTPVFAFAIPGVWATWRSGERMLAALIASVSLAVIVTYIFTGPRNYGGTAQGMRWFIVLVPLLWLSAARWAAARWDRRAARVGFRFAVVASIVQAALVLPKPWRVGPWNELMRQLGLGSVPPFNTVFGP
jgi:hypothetical protein